jgi:hypothetical protein
MPVTADMLRYPSYTAKQFNMFLVVPCIDDNAILGLS